MKLFYRETGSGIPLVILHGLFGMADNWHTLAKKYGAHFRTFTLDQRNHGQSEHAQDFNYFLMAEDLKNWMNEQNLTSAHIMGHSMGGKTAMFFARAYPEKVDKLIVSDIAPRYYPVHHQTILDALFSIDLSQLTSRKEAEQHLESRISDWGTRQFLLKNLHWKDEKLAWRFNLTGISENIEEVGKELPEDFIFEKETLFVRGGNSTYIADSDIEDIHTRFPKAQLVTIENSGHWIHAEKPEEYLKITLDFLMR